MEEKKSIKVSLGTVVCIFIIILLIVALGVVYYLGFIKSNNSTNVIVKDEDQSLISQLNESNTNKVATDKNVVGNYIWEITTNDYTYGIRLVLANDNTFGCYFETGGVSGSYSIKDNTIYLNEIFRHGSGMGLDLVKNVRTVIINQDGTLEIQDIKVEYYPTMPSTIKFKKTSEDISNFDIRNEIRGSVGTGTDSYIAYEYEAKDVAEKFVKAVNEKDWKKAAEYSSEQLVNYIKKYNISNLKIDTNEIMKSPNLTGYNCESSYDINYNGLSKDDLALGSYFCIDVVNGSYVVTAFGATGL